MRNLISKQSWVWQIESYLRYSKHDVLHYLGVALGQWLQQGSRVLTYPNQPFWFWIKRGFCKK